MLGLVKIPLRKSRNLVTSGLERFTGDTKLKTSKTKTLVALASCNKATPPSSKECSIGLNSESNPIKCYCISHFSAKAKFSSPTASTNTTSSLCSPKSSNKDSPPPTPSNSSVGLKQSSLRKRLGIYSFSPISYCAKTFKGLFAGI